MPVDQGATLLAPLLGVMPVVWSTSGNLLVTADRSFDLWDVLCRPCIARTRLYCLLVCYRCDGLISAPLVVWCIPSRALLEHKGP